MFEIESKKIQFSIIRITLDKYLPNSLYQFLNPFQAVLIEYIFRILLLKSYISQDGQCSWSINSRILTLRIFTVYLKL